MVVARQWGRGGGDARWWWHGGGRVVVGLCPPESRRVLGCVLGAGGTTVALVACAQRCFAPAPPLCGVQLGELVCTSGACLCRRVHRRLAVWELAGAEHELCARCVCRDEFWPFWCLAESRTDAPLRCVCRPPEHGTSVRSLLLLVATAMVVYEADKDAAGKGAT